MWRSGPSTRGKGDGMSRIALLALALLAGPEPSYPAAHVEPPQMKVTTYLLFDGDCREAMTFYRSVLGGELTMTTVGESPMAAAFPPAMHGKVVSAHLTNAMVDLSASDWLRPGIRAVRGNRVMLYISGGSQAETRRVFQKLSEGAEVTDPLKEQPFGLYGALNDRFGNRWMFHADPS